MEREVLGWSSKIELDGIRLECDVMGSEFVGCGSCDCGTKANLLCLVTTFSDGYGMVHFGFTDGVQVGYYIYFC